VVFHLPPLHFCQAESTYASLCRGVEDASVVVLWHEADVCGLWWAGCIYSIFVHAGCICGSAVLYVFSGACVRGIRLTLAVVAL
jgi:hypothetical protein